MRRRVIGITVLGLLVVGCAVAPRTPEPSASIAATASLAPSSPPVPVVAGLRYGCNGEPPGFAPDLLDQPANAELEGHPSADALRTAVAAGGPEIDMLPAGGYWLVDRDDLRATYLATARPAMAGEPAFAEATVENRGGIWQLSGWGQCRPRVVLEGLSAATWQLDPDQPAPGPASTQVAALVSEIACTGGMAMGARLEPPSITYTDAAVLVVFAARPLEGDSFDCPGNPPSRVVLELREPLGERRLLDAAEFPARDPSKPPFGG
jgi:hypothetical protein